ncbi:MAG: SDR family NAD(P)-dependent oxidoreductase [Legionellaceae bacterium]|nr:SDR family NAD(P)-dependent oxidoreductase [Legionellaceae bacterium]
MKLRQQVVIITGGASGMGKACVERFYGMGLNVAVWDQQCAPAIEERKLQIACDVTDEAQVQQALQQTLEHLGRPSILVNCAGIAPAKKILGREGVMALDGFSKVIAVNLIGSFNVMRLVAEVMAKNEVHAAHDERGVIINTASIAAFEGQIGQTAYSASKGGVVAMTLPAARELATHAIRVNTIAPGLIATPMLAAMPQEVQKSLAETVTYPQRLGQGDEFAALVQHIVENQYINGETIRLDGALRMQAR